MAAAPLTSLDDAVQLGSEETGTQRLNLAQSFNLIGSIPGVVSSKFLILPELNQ